MWRAQNAVLQGLRSRCTARASCGERATQDCEESRNQSQSITRQIHAIESAAHQADVHISSLLDTRESNVEKAKSIEIVTVKSNSLISSLLETREYNAKKDQAHRECNECQLRSADLINTPVSAIHTS